MMKRNLSLTTLILVLPCMTYGLRPGSDGSNACYPVGATHIYRPMINNKDELDVGKKPTYPYVKFDLLSWDEGFHDKNGYKVRCNCSDAKYNEQNRGGVPAYIRTSIPLRHSATINHPGGPSMPAQSMEFYELNEFLDIGVALWIHGGLKQFKSAPFNNVSNQGRKNNICDYNDNRNNEPHNPYYGAGETNQQTGSKGRISFRVKKPFIGKVSFNNINILNVYSGLTPGKGAQPIASVFVSGNIIVQQKCTIEPSSSTTINLGDKINSNEFVNTSLKIGEKPPSALVQTTKLKYSCNEKVGEDIEVSDFIIRFHGESNQHYKEALKTTNENIGVMILDKNLQHIIPNDSNRNFIDIKIDPKSLNGETEITSHVVKVSDKQPKEGTFTAEATISVQYK